MRAFSLCLPVAASQGMSLGDELGYHKNIHSRSSGRVTNYGEGFRFQALGVILAKNKCRELKASEPKSDLGLDAYAPGELFENGVGRGVACSNTATLTKIREDIEEAQKHFTDLKVLFFATPRPVSEKKTKGWREKVKKGYGITLIVISREEVISELLKPENASLCSSILRIPTAIEASLGQIANDCRVAIAEINTWRVPRIPGAPLIDLSADHLGSRGNQTDSILELKDLPGDVSAKPPRDARSARGTRQDAI
jgi:hypothetical protein